MFHTHTQSPGKKFAQEIIVTFSPFHFLLCVLFKMTHFTRRDDCEIFSKLDTS